MAVKDIASSLFLSSSCFPSPKTKRKCAKFPEAVYAKSSARKKESPIKFIDKTPSANSLNLPYCPPVKLDYESFSNVDLLAGRTEDFLSQKNCSRLPTLPLPENFSCPHHWPTQQKYCSHLRHWEPKNCSRF